MTTLREAAQQALEALETNQYAVADQAPHVDVMAFNAAITALRAALAEPQSTHSTECYKWHHDCAVAEVERLRAAIAKAEGDKNGQT